MASLAKRYADLVARLRVPSGFLIVVAFAWFSHPTARSLAVGLPVSLLGLGLRAWAAGCLAKDQRLASGGPYAYTRNPLYLGTLVVAAGFVIAARNAGLGVLFAAIFLLIYVPVIQLEQQHLRKLFRDYAAYAAQVPALWPRLTPLASRDRHAFQWARYARNREYQAAAGFACWVVFLTWKALR